MGAKASLHMEPRKGFEAAQGNENERRNWDFERYSKPEDYKGAPNYYDWFRRHLNFEIVDGEIRPLMSHQIPLHERLQNRLTELGFKKFKVDAPNAPNMVMDFVIGGNQERMREMAFGQQSVNYEEPDEKNLSVTRQKDIEDWAMDTYRWAVEKYGAENIIGFNVHLDETTPHIHMLVVPVGEVTKNGKVKKGGERGKKTAVSYASVVGKRPEDLKKYLDDLHTDYHMQVGYKYKLERGTFFDDLTPLEKLMRIHRLKKDYILFKELLREYEEKIRQQEEKIKEQDETINRQATTISEQKQQLYDINKELKQAEKRIKGLTTMIKNLEEQKERIEIDIAALEEMNRNGEITNEELEKKKGELEGQLQDIESKLSDKSTKLSDAKTELNDIKTSIHRLADDAIKRHDQTNKAIANKRTELLKMDKTGELTRAYKHIKDRDAVIYRHWPEAQAAVKAIYERADSVTSREFSEQQALDVEKAISTSGISRDDAANELLSLATKDFDNNRTWQAWIDDAVSEVLAIAKHVHPLSPFLDQQAAGIDGGGSSGGNDLPKDKDDDRFTGYQAMKPKGRK